MIEVEATTAVVLATRERENAFLQFGSRCVQRERLCVYVVIEA